MVGMARYYLTIAYRPKSSNGPILSLVMSDNCSFYSLVKYKNYRERIIIKDLQNHYLQDFFEVIRSRIGEF